MSGRYIQTSEAPLPSGHSHVGITLAAPQRSNSLEPDILLELAAALDDARDIEAAFITIRAEGRHFSSGGDVAAFYRASQTGQAEAYSDLVVGLLQQVLRRLLTLPAIVLTAAQGAVSGGSAGLLFASDLVVLADDAFVQPYFSRVGFSPDGGWSALLPERIGAGRALQIQLTNERIDAHKARDLGLAHEVVSADRLSETLNALTADLAREHDPAAMAAAKQLVWDAERLALLDSRLDAELKSFKRQIVKPATSDGMRTFLDQLSKAG
jgi:2-(1,2-epoxy-1,2-dihydrophenyl)acetyl-CoA isomerase